MFSTAGIFKRQGVAILYSLTFDPRYLAMHAKLVLVTLVSDSCKLVTQLLSAFMNSGDRPKSDMKHAPVWKENHIIKKINNNNISICIEPFARGYKALLPIITVSQKSSHSFRFT